MTTIMPKLLGDPNQLAPNPLNRHLYVYEPPPPLEVIEADIKTLEGEILALPDEVTA